jgi:hypothetical protein
LNLSNCKQQLFYLTKPQWYSTFRSPGKRLLGLSAGAFGFRAQALTNNIRGDFGIWKVYDQ